MSNCCKISKVFYKELDTDIREAGEFYFNYNMLPIHEMFHDAYEESETKQINLRNQILGEEIRAGNIDGKVKVESTILAISSLKNKVIILTNIY